MAPHSTPLPPQCAQSYLAVFLAGLGILIIGGKEEKSPDSILNRRPPMGGLFHSRRPVHAAALPSRSTSHPGHPPGSPCQNAPAKGFGCNGLPQSKRALREPPRMQPLAIVPGGWGGPLTVPASHRYRADPAPATGTVCPTSASKSSTPAIFPCSMPERMSYSTSSGSASRTSLPDLWPAK